MPAFVPLCQISQAGLETITALWLSASIILSYLLISVSCIQEQWCVCHYAMRYYTTWWMYISLCYRSRAWQLCGQAVDRLDEVGLSVLVLVPGQSSRELVQGACRCLEIWSHPETRHTRPVSHRCPCTPRRLLPRYITSDTMNLCNPCRMLCNCDCWSNRCQSYLCMDQVAHVKHFKGLVWKRVL